VSQYWNKHSGPVKPSQDNARPVKVIKLILFMNFFITYLLCEYKNCALKKSGRGSKAMGLKY